MFRAVSKSLFLIHEMTLQKASDINGSPKEIKFIKPKFIGLSSNAKKYLSLKIYFNAPMVHGTAKDTSEHFVGCHFL